MRRGYGERRMCWKMRVFNQPIMNAFTGIRYLKTNPLLSSYP